MAKSYQQIDLDEIAVDIILNCSKTGYLLYCIDLQNVHFCDAMNKGFDTFFRRTDQAKEIAKYRKAIESLINGGFLSEKNVGKYSHTYSVTARGYELVDSGVLEIGKEYCGQVELDSIPQSSAVFIIQNNSCNGDVNNEFHTA